jgi:fructose-specific component phosphotransferase system IIB-like protein
MADMTTALESYTNNGNSRTYQTATHSILEPRLVIQKRKPAATIDANAQDDISVVFGSLDTDGNPLAAKIVFAVNIRRSPMADSDTVTAAKALFREIVASDNFDDVITGQKWVQT